ncbi:MAG TPA: tRNA (adenosine(37)-N6)-dimethylallyltransferase MiaA [Bacteroidales bacterium]|nr:tRNA (adenosine(37)-N6)-dimethylallyltransferase MiaA [Bacteroidales bacterium]
MEPTLVSIVGPTAVGKTEIGVQLAERFSSEIISADSRQMFRELKIGTALPSPEQLSRAKHHFIGNLSIHDYYNVSMFEQDVLTLLSGLFRGKPLLFMVGGSTLYVNAVYHGIDDLPTVDPALRNDLQQQYQEQGIEFLRLKLKMLDPDYYQRVDLKNPNRLLKAIEISLMTGKPYSSLLTAPKRERDFRIIKIGLNKSREELFEQINRRVDEMFDLGLPEEARALYPYKSLNSLNTVGYKELFLYIENKISLDEARELIKKNTRNYAKRQLTWFKRYDDMVWFHPDQVNEIQQFLKERMDG